MNGEDTRPFHPPRLSLPSAPALRFVLQGIGSRGDIVPLIELGARLVARGHECHLLANAKFQDEAVARGLVFHTISHFTTNYRGSEAYRLDNHLFAGLEPVAEFFRRTGPQAARTVVVNLDWAAASSLLAERHALATVRLHLCPFKIRSLVSPSWPLRDNTRGLLGRTFHKYKLPAIYAAFDRDPRVLARVNAARRAVGLPAVASATQPERYIVRELAFFPRWYGRPASDWPRMSFAGFPLPPASGELPEPLQEWIERGQRPLVFTPGTGVDDVGAFFAQARRCLEILGRPGVFLSPYLKRSQPRRDLQVLELDHLELGLLLPHAALLVHHGGVGTTARALEAGVPQVISPLCFDQPDNAGRVSELGVGEALPRVRLTGESLALAAQRLLGSAAVRERLAALQRAIARDRALERASDWLEADAHALARNRSAACAGRGEPLRRPA